MNISSSKYHQSTSYDRSNMEGHYLDWRSQPSPYKNYQETSPLPLPPYMPGKKTRLSAILNRPRNNPSRNIDIEELSIILRHAYTLTAKGVNSGEDFYFRSAASAGALYPTEIYIEALSISGLDDGLYHFGIKTHGLSLLRKYKSINSEENLPDNSVSQISKLTFLFTAIIFRSAWKYRARAYRYNLLDTGHVIDNLELALKDRQLPFRLSYDFDDETINSFLGLDQEKEVTLGIIQVPESETGDHFKPKEVDVLPSKIKAASIVSNKEISYPGIQEIHRAGFELPSTEVPIRDMTFGIGLKPDNWGKIEPSPTTPEIMDYPDVVFHRRSNRNFTKDLIKKDQVSFLINSLYSKASLDTINETPYSRTISTAFIAGNNVEGFDPGIYLLDKGKEATGLVKRGLFIEHMSHICLDQQWLANAGIHFLFMGNLNMLDQKLGPRGYRYGMLTAGKMGERLYLTSTALGLGCCGIGAFYDNEAAELIGLNNDSKLLYLVAAGPVKSFTYK